MYIEKLLEIFTDDALTSLESDASAGSLRYNNPSRCLLGHYQDGYARAKFMGNTLMNAGNFAEQEFWALGVGDADRCTNLLPLIDAEWKRRRVKEAPVKEEEAVCV